MHRIDIDDSVYRFLQTQARPFEDPSPNHVLRRLLLGEARGNGSRPLRQGRERAAQGAVTAGVAKHDRIAWVHRILQEAFGDGFQTRHPFRLLFQDGRQTVYFQNFEKQGAPSLWYRLPTSALRILRENTSSGTVVLTNPAEGSAYLIPFREVERRIRDIGWKRSTLEINIDVACHRWKELDWKLGTYFRRFSQGRAGR